MKIRYKATIKAMAVATVLTVASALPTHAYTIFENLPTNPNIVDPLTESHHGVAGPILADDFVPESGGIVNRVEWWGSNAASDMWELAFHTNAATNQPNIDDPVEGALIKYGAGGDVTAVGVADVADHPDIFHYTVDLPGPLFLGVNSGTEYWFTVANFLGGWHWATALAGPTVGSENFNTHQSTGVGLCGDGGPHCGPWTDVHTDMAFRLNAVPEPGSLALAGLGFGLAMMIMRRRKVEDTPLDSLAA